MSGIMSKVKKEKNTAIQSSETHDELSACRELDAVIAEKIMGWTRATRSPKAYDIFREGKGGDVWWIGGCPAPTAYECDHPENQVFAPSENIADAWKAVERLMRDGWRFEIDRNVKVGEPLNDFDCTFVKGRLFRATAETAPLAICRAALKVVETS